MNQNPSCKEDLRKKEIRNQWVELIEILDLYENLDARDLANSFDVNFYSMEKFLGMMFYIKFKEYIKIKHLILEKYTNFENSSYLTEN